MVFTMISRSFIRCSSLSSSTSSIHQFLHRVPSIIESSSFHRRSLSPPLSLSFRNHSAASSASSTSTSIHSSPPPTLSSPSSPTFSATATLDSPSAAPLIPSYLNEVYWWTYVSERAVWVFERNWLVNLILWGNFNRLSSMALKELKNTVNNNNNINNNNNNTIAGDTYSDTAIPGKTLQVACVYGNFSLQLSSLCQSLTVLDVLPVQLTNLSKKLLSYSTEINQDLLKKTRLILNDSSKMESLKTNEFDRAVLFFLLHEMPEETRINTIKETFRVMKPGSTLIIVDYHRPNNIILYKIMELVLKNLEPFAMDLWNNEIKQFLPKDADQSTITKQTIFNGLYQLITIKKQKE